MGAWGDAGLVVGGPSFTNTATGVIATARCQFSTDAAPAPTVPRPRLDRLAARADTKVGQPWSALAPQARRAVTTRVQARSLSCRRREPTSRAATPHHGRASTRATGYNP